MAKRKSASSLSRSPFPERLQGVLTKMMDTPRGLRDLEWGYSILAAALNPNGKHAPAEMESAYERCCCGQQAELNDLRFELQKLEEKAMCQRLARMTPAEKRQVLLYLGKAFLVIMSCQPSEPRQQLPPEIMAGLLQVD